MRDRFSLRLLFTSSIALAIGMAGAASAWAGSCNTPPVAQADTYDILGTTFAADVLNNDRDDDGELLTLSVLSENCANHTVTSSNGVLLVSPSPTHGPEPLVCLINYRIRDERGAQSTAIVTINLHLFSNGFESGDIGPWTLGVGEEPN